MEKPSASLILRALRFIQFQSSARQFQLTYSAVFKNEQSVLLGSFFDKRNAKNYYRFIVVRMVGYIN